MKFYLAPMEGITGYVYRNLYSSYFDNIDKYFTPFIVGNRKAGMKARELKDVLPENNGDLYIVPQILTNNSVEFIETAKRLLRLGYSEINLNLGCPSQTVVSKGRGAGFLKNPWALDEFLSEIFDVLSDDFKISLKTRLGMESAEEFGELLDIYKKYPLCELIVHPRTRKELYGARPHIEEFYRAYSECPFPVSYNGDICTVRDYQNITERFEKLDSVMIGRGILANPFLVDEIMGRASYDKEFLREFNIRLFDEYRRVLSGDKDVLFKMKELWFYESRMFKDCDRYLKAIRKADDRMEYMCAVNSLLDNCEVR